MTSKILLGAVATVMTLALPLAVNAANEPSSAAAAAAAKKKTTDVSFDDVLVQGKYHFSDEAVTTVENDKVLDALLAYELILRTA